MRRETDAAHDGVKIFVGPIQRSEGIDSFTERLATHACAQDIVQPLLPADKSYGAEARFLQPDPTILARRCRDRSRDPNHPILAIALIFGVLIDTYESIPGSTVGDLRHLP